jgi:hypothetical protein
MRNFFYFIKYYFKYIYIIIIFFKFYLRQIFKKVIFNFNINKENFRDPRTFWESFYDKKNIFNNKLSLRLLGQEIRNCFVLQKKSNYIFKATSVQTILRLGFFFEKKFFQEIEGNVQLKVNGFEIKKLLELEKLLFNEWHDSWIKIKKNCNVEIINNTNCDVYVSKVLTKALTKNVNKKYNKVNNIIFLVLDSLDVDLMKEKNYLLNSKNIFKFFKNKIIYKNCFSSSEWTIPWISSFFKGMSASAHRLTDTRDSFEIKNPYSNNLIDLLIKNDFFTVGLGNKSLYNPWWKNLSGFNRFFPTKGSFEKNLNILNVSKKIIEVLESGKSTKNFFFAHVMDTHFPWAQRSYSEQYKIGPKRICDPYYLFKLQDSQRDTKSEPIYNADTINKLKQYARIRLQEVDRDLNFLFTYLNENNLLSKTMFILTSDHGYTYHGKYKHLLNFKRTNVPLFISHPDLNKKNNNSLINNSTDLYDLLVNFILNKRQKNFNQIKKFNKYLIRKNKYLISESIFGKKYKASVRSSKNSYHISCEYSTEYNSIFLSKKYYEDLYNFNETKKIKDKKKIILFDNVLRNFLNKNFSGKII